MSNEFKHVSVGTELTQAEYESITGHAFDSQATGDIPYASSAAQISRLGIGSTSQVLLVSGGLPAWSSNIPSLDYLAVNQATGYQLRSTVDTGVLTFTGGTDGNACVLVMYGKSHVTHPGKFYLYTTNASAKATSRMVVAGNLNTTTVTWASCYHVGLKFGLAGTATGAFTMGGATSGVVTVTVAAAAGTWTLTLPPDDGDAGEQLQTNGSGVTTWEAAGSLSKYKNLTGHIDPKEALDKLLSLPIHTFKYREKSLDGSRVISTGDFKTEYVGIIAEEAPFLMHHNGKIFNPVNAFGYATAAIQALNERVEKLEGK